MRRRRLFTGALVLIVLLAGAVTTSASAGDPKDDPQVVDVCDGSERDPQAGVPVPADYDICSLTLRQPVPRSRNRVAFTVAMRQLPSAATERAVSLQVLWTLPDGCEQGLWRRSRTDAGTGLVTELFERCAGETRYRFVPGVLSTTANGGKELTVVVESPRFEDGTVLRPKEVFTEVALFAVANPQKADERAHGGAGVADRAGPGREFRIR